MGAERPRHCFCRRLAYTERPLDNPAGCTSKGWKRVPGQNELCSVVRHGKDIASCWQHGIKCVALAVCVGYTGTVRADLILEMPPTFLEQTASALDGTRANLNAQYQEVARKLDSFFKRPDAPESSTNSTARARLMLKLEDGESPSLSAAFSAKMALPFAEERLHLFVDNIQRGALPGDEDPTLGDDSFQVGMRFWLLQSIRSHLSLEGGVKLHGIPDPFGQVEYKYEQRLDGWVGRFTQDGFCYTKEGLGELSQVDIERPFQNKALFRSTTAANYTQESTGVQFEQTLLTDIPLPGQRRNLILSTSVFAQDNGCFLMEDYRAFVTYRTVFFRPWLILEITPQIEFPRERNYEFTPSIQVGFEIWFGSLPEDN